ncbi:MAG: peptidylprolyl isomerase [Bacteroidia bacterium]|nr:peptidylprolyl isomerase [Bacteroidia bacterium]
MAYSCKQEEKMPDDTELIMHTEYGDVFIRLYDETPIHKANFLKLCKEGFYDGQVFHRIVNNFMVQAGDPRTKTEFPPKDRNKPIDAGYTLPAEIIPKLAHTYGKLGAARKDTSVNPERRSSSSQFYIVTGRKISDLGIDSLETDRSGFLQEEEYFKYLELVDSSEFKGSFVEFLDSIDFKGFSYNPKQVRTYKNLGGAPWLDNEYTIFGEVLKGMEIIERIQVLPTNRYEIPNTAVRITSIEIIEQ